MIGTGRYTCWGRVRGACGVAHRSVGIAGRHTSRNGKSRKTFRLKPDGFREPLGFREAVYSFLLRLVRRN
jgi:hypothetical protein